MSRVIGILLFDGAEEMDVVGPWQVFTAAMLACRANGCSPLPSGGCRSSARRACR